MVMYKLRVVHTRLGVPAIVCDGNALSNTLLIRFYASGRWCHKPITISRTHIMEDDTAIVTSQQDVGNLIDIIAANTLLVLRDAIKSKNSERTGNLYETD